MSSSESMGSFFRDNKNLVKDYLETRLEIYRLKGIRAVSKTAGYLIWLVIAIFLIWMIGLFAALVFAFWMSELTGSLVAGFAITLSFVILKVILLTVFRKQLFVNPIIRRILKKMQDEAGGERREAIGGRRV